MNKEMYLKIEKYMLACMRDGAHDRQHIYRVLYTALDLAGEFDEVDKDVLIAAALLHDIGRDAQFKNPECDHAIVGSGMAYEFLLEIGWDEDKAAHVRDSIATHRYRGDNPPGSAEAKVLFDADKLDATGTLGIARTLVYQGVTSQPLYTVDEMGDVLTGGMETEDSFFKEYKWKLKKVHDRFFTGRARDMAIKRRKASMDFYESMCSEVKEIHRKGAFLLNEALK